MKNYGLLLAALFVLSACCGKQQQEAQRVENVILMIGDGMGVAHVSQLIIENELKPVAMERAEAVGLVRTFSANNRVTDSAAGGTAIATGTKTINGRIGRDAQGNDIYSILHYAQEAGYPTGLVVTVDLFDATPGAFYAHVHRRQSRDTIALQLLSSGIDVAMGGGREYLDERADGRVLTDEFREKGYRVALNGGYRGRATSGGARPRRNALLHPRPRRLPAPGDIEGIGDTLGKPQGTRQPRIFPDGRGF